MLNEFEPKGDLLIKKSGLFGAVDSADLKHSPIALSRVQSSLRLSISGGSRVLEALLHSVVQCDLDESWRRLI